MYICMLLVSRTVCRLCHLSVEAFTMRKPSVAHDPNTAGYVEFEAMMSHGVMMQVQLLRLDRSLYVADADNSHNGLNVIQEHPQP